MHQRVEALKAEIEALEKRASVLKDKASFLDCVVDVIERYVLPACEVAYMKAAE